MCLHNEGRREVAALGSMCCIRVLSSFWVQAISEQPFSLQGQTMCSTASMCVMNETGTFFFLALLSLSARGSIQRYTKWWLDTHGFIASLNTFPLWPGVGPRSDWCLYHWLSSRCASLHCQTLGQRRICLWCVFFHSMFVFLSVYAQAHSLFDSLLSKCSNVADTFSFKKSCSVIHVCTETHDCSGDIYSSKGLLNGLAGKGITSAVSLLFSGLLYLAALDCTYPHYLWFSSPQRKESISLKTFSSALAVPLKDFAVLFG